MAEPRSTLLLPIVVVLACGPEWGRELGPTGGIAPGSADDETATGSNAEDDAGWDTDGAGGSGNGGGLIFDVGAGPTEDTGEAPEGCKKVDFLFVVDNSASMENEQAALVNAFPDFMDTIESTLGTQSDFHVLVTDTDAWGRCDTANGWQGSDSHSDLCNQYIEDTTFDECDRTLGAGVVHPAGEFATNALCSPQGGKRYLEQGEPDLGAQFACMATVGVAGHAAERPMDALMAALTPEINGPGGCNDGFLREDALLVVTFISDDPWYEDAGDFNAWYATVVAAKSGDPAAVVMLGLTPAWDGCRDDTGPPKGGHWAQFVSLFADHGLHGNVCSDAAQYVAFFEMAVSVIDDACSDFEPPG